MNKERLTDVDQSTLHRPGQSKKDLQQEIQRIQRSIAVYPENSQYYNLLASAYQRADNDKNAILAYRRALSLNPRCTESLLGLGLIHKRRNELDWAIRYYLKAIGVDPSQPAAYNNLGTAYRAQGNLKKQLLVFDRPSASILPIKRGS